MNCYNVKGVYLVLCQCISLHKWSLSKIDSLKPIASGWCTYMHLECKRMSFLFSHFSVVLKFCVFILFQVMDVVCGGFHAVVRLGLGMLNENEVCVVISIIIVVIGGMFKQLQCWDCVVDLVAVQEWNMLKHELCANLFDYIIIIIMLHN